MRLRDRSLRHYADTLAMTNSAWPPQPESLYNSLPSLHDVPLSFVSNHKSEISSYYRSLYTLASGLTASLPLFSPYDVVNSPTGVGARNVGESYALVRTGPHYSRGQGGA